MTERRDNFVYTSDYATGWTTEKSGFDSRQDEEFCLLHSVQTGSGARLALYSMGTLGSFPRSTAVGTWS
jgi:hypothetical protein